MVVGKMRINVSYISRIHYVGGYMSQWFWKFEKYKFVKGVKIRICGIYFNIRDKDALDKLIKIGKEKPIKIGK
jgi:hypothetical protein